MYDTSCPLTIEDLLDINGQNYIREYSGDESLLLDQKDFQTNKKYNQQSTSLWGAKEAYLLSDPSDSLEYEYLLC